MGKFETAVATYELIFFLGRQHGVTSSAANEPGEGKFALGFEARVAAAAKKRLNPIVFIFGNHWIVLSLVPFPALLWILKLPIIEWFGENLINAAPAKELAAHLTGTSGAKAPFIVGEGTDLCRCI